MMILPGEVRAILRYYPKIKMEPEKIVARKLLSFFNGPVLGDILVLGWCNQWRWMISHVGFIDLRWWARVT